MTNVLKLCCKRKMKSSSNPEELSSPDSTKNSDFVSFPPRFDNGDRTLTCPTCGGSGKLTREHENDLVALIPVRDGRLKSKKRVYIIIAILIFAIIAGVLAAVFLFPRDVQLKMLNSTAFNITLAGKNETKAYMFLNNTLQINNNNYFHVTVNKVNQQIMWSGSYVVADKAFVGQHLTVPAKSSIKHKYIVKLEYDGKQLCEKMKRACCWFRLMFIVVTQANADGVTVSQDISNKVYKYVDCLEDDSNWDQKCGDTS